MELYDSNGHSAYYNIGGCLWRTYFSTHYTIRQHLVNWSRIWYRGIFNCHHWIYSRLFNTGFYLQKKSRWYFRGIKEAGVYKTLPPPLSLRLSLLCFPLSKFPLPLLALEKGLYLREQDTGQGSEELPLQAVCAASVDLVSLGILAHGQSAVRCPSSFIEFFFCNYFTCELADHTWGSMPLFLNVTQHTEYGSQKQQATCSGREPDKKAAGPLCNTENDLLRLTGEQQILSVDLKIRF